MSILSYNQARATIAGTIYADQQVWYAYKDGVAETFDSESAAFARSDLIEPSSVRRRIVSEVVEQQKVRNVVIESVLATCGVSREWFDAMYYICTQDRYQSIDPAHFDTTINRVVSGLKIIGPFVSSDSERMSESSLPYYLTSDPIEPY